MAQVANETLDRSVFLRLRKLYLLTFMAIAVSIIVSEIFVQNYLDKQLSDSRVINQAGRQRMLSQKLTKEILLLERYKSGSVQADRMEELKNTLAIWEETHRGLLRGDEKLELPGENSAQIGHTYADIQAPFEIMVANAQAILKIMSEDSAASNPDLAGI